MGRKLNCTFNKYCLTGLFCADRGVRDAEQLLADGSIFHGTVYYYNSPYVKVGKMLLANGDVWRGQFYYRSKEKHGVVKEIPASGGVAVIHRWYKGVQMHAISAREFAEYFNERDPDKLR